MNYKKIKVGDIVEYIRLVDDSDDYQNIYYLDDVQAIVRYISRNRQVILVQVIVPDVEKGYYKKLDIFERIDRKSRNDYANYIAYIVNMWAKNWKQVVEGYLDLDSELTEKWDDLNWEVHTRGSVCEIKILDKNNFKFK